MQPCLQPGTAHLTIQASLPALVQRPDGPLLTLVDDQGPLVELVLRTLGPVRPGDREQYENYARYPLVDGRVRVVEAVWHFPTPERLIAHRVARRAEMRERFPELSPYVPEPELAAGLLFVGLPLALIGDRPCRAALRLREHVIELFIDGVLVDEEWPLDPMRGGTCWLACATGVTASVEARSDVALPPADAQRTAELVPHARPVGSYWAPPGHNTWAGDTMMASDGERLHVLWLRDRHQHHAKWGCGVAGFWHMSSADLRDWTQHPPAWPLSARNIAAMGTSCVVHHEGRWFAFSNLCNERLGPTLWGDRPAGQYVAVSEDGITFHEVGHIGIDGEMGVLRDPDTGRWHGVKYAARVESDDLLHWRVADQGFLPTPNDHTDSNSDEGFTVECWTWAKVGDWHYVLGGRTGMWMSRDLFGPYWARPGVDPAQIARPRWTVYDGLLVPQICMHRGRAILSGFTGNFAYGGHLVFREVVQEADGTLGTRFLEETMPERREVLPLFPPACVEADRLALLDGLSGPVRLHLQLEPGAAVRRFGLLIGDDGRDGLEWRAEPARRRMQWGERRDGVLPGDSNGPRCFSEDFALSAVEGLDRVLTIELVILDDRKSGNTIVDLCLNGQRTMLTRRRGLGHRRLGLWSDGDGLRIRALTAWRLDWLG